MVRTLTICFVDPDPIRIRAFLWAHLPGGLWSLLDKEYYSTAFLGVRIFASRERLGMFLLIETWTSAESLDAAKRTPAFRVLERFQRNLAISTLDCRTFRTPPANRQPDESAPATQAGSAGLGPELLIISSRSRHYQNEKLRITKGLAK